MNTPTIGCSKDDLDTPVLYVDLDAIEANIRRMADTCRENNIQWRPHSKCHKSSVIAKKLIDAGAMGITCAKLGEAEVMADGGVKDILIANLIVGPMKVRRLVEVRKKADPIVCIDHIDQALPISKAMEEAGLKMRVIVEVNIGLHRVGTEPGEPTLQLARQLAELPGIELAGIMGYEGQTLTIPDSNEKAEKIDEALTILTDTAQLLRDNGLPCEIVSCGGTGSFYYSVKQPGITELQAGGGIFMDAFYRHCCHVEDHENSMFVIATVVGRPAPDRAIIDAGRKTMHGDHHEPLVVGREGIEVASLSAEHGSLKLAPCAQDLKIGDRLTIIPGYSDMTAVLHDQMYAFRGDKLEVIWKLEGRGRLQ